MCLKIEVQYLGNAAWYGVGVNRWPIGNHPGFMLYRLARPPLTQRDWKVKDRFGLVRSANSAQAQSLLLCPALSYSALSWEAPRKSWVGHSKKNFLALRAGICAPTFEMLPAPLCRRALSLPWLSSERLFFADTLVYKRKQNAKSIFDGGSTTFIINRQYGTFICVS